MKFDKSKSINKDNNLKIYLNKVDTDETIMIDEEYIFLDSIKTEKEIVITKKTIILGDLDCSFLNVLSRLICYGNIKANTIFSTVDIECYKEVSYNNLMSGNIKNQCGNDVKESEKIIEVVKEIEKKVIVEVNPFDNVKLNKDNIDYLLSLVDEFKDKIIDYSEAELIFGEDSELINELGKIGLTFSEFKSDSEYLKKIKKYSNLEYIISLKEYLEFLKVVKDTPSWLEEIDLVENTVEKLMIHSFEDLKELELELKDQDDILILISDIITCKKQLNGYYNDLIDYIINKYNNLFIKPEYIEKNNDIEKEIVKSNIDVTDLYEEYIWKKGSLLEYTVKSIKADYLELYQVGQEKNEQLSIILKTKETSRYVIGQTILGCILKVNINKEKLDIEVVNDSDNMPRLIFKYLSSRNGLTNSIIQNYSRIKGKSTCIVIALSKSILYNNKIKVVCKNIESEMKKYLNGEIVNIFIYNKDPKIFASNILDINESNIRIDKDSKKCIVNNIYIPDENRINNLLHIQNDNLEKIFNYKIEIPVKKLI